MKLPRTYYNFISYLGTITAIIAWVTLIFFFIQIQVFNFENVYFELFAYIVTPGFLLLGLLLIPFGMYREKKKIKKGLPASDEKLLVINLKDTKTVNAVIIFSIVTVIFVIFTITGSYQAYHYTESVEFCGTLCHKVMEPEHTAYQHSPHARVKCAECHVGEGADFYVKSKMSGLRQVYKYLTNTYPRPIATPIANLRPARETCERCHWPQKFYTNKIRNEKYYLADEKNTEWNVILKMRIGADHSALGNTQGIHWHISPDVEIEYASDAKRQTIPWVKYKNKATGKEYIYNDSEYKDTKNTESLSKMEHRSMDCMDCHNRPSHEYLPPSHYVNQLFAGNKISSTVPYLKAAAMEALKVNYSTKDSAFIGIKNTILNYYKSNQADAGVKYKNEIANAISEIQQEFSYNTFPEMKVSYAVYPRNIGHLENNGCFRCHDDKHKSPEGKVISKSCNICHTIIAQGKKDSVAYSPINGNLDFKHPADIGDEWKTTNCSECHYKLY